MNLLEIRKKYLDENYLADDATAKVCQDIILSKISRSSLAQNVTIKGGVVMHHLSKDNRRATRDMDLDFIKYSLEDKSLENFINKLNSINDNVKLRILYPIEKLNHKDYSGKRIYIELTDEYNNKINSKLDIGVHKDFDIKQEEYCFDLSNISETVTLLINSKEQIFTEKLKSLLRIGIRSTRYKDVFDMYYLINDMGLDKDKLKRYFNKIIFNDETMFENNIFDIYQRLDEILRNKGFLKELHNLKGNWLSADPIQCTETILKFIKSLEE